MKQSEKFIQDMNRHVGDAKIIGDVVGKVLWVDIKDDTGIIRDDCGNEYFFNPSSVAGFGVIKDQLVRFTAIQPHSFKPNLIALDIRDFLA